MICCRSRVVLFLSWIISWSVIIIPVQSARKSLPTPATEIPTRIDKSNPLRVFLLGGQSHCVGTSSVELFNNDTNYEEFQGTQHNVWYAGIKKKAKSTDPSRFFLKRLQAGEGSQFDTRFGPEVSLGKRLSDGLDANVLIVKYCVGGTSLFRRWDPTTIKNSWNRTEDDGTANYLENRTDFTDTDYMYINFVYTARRALELLIEGNVPHVLSGFFWLQSFSDKKRTWQQYGNDSIHLFTAIRSDFGIADLPIVDSWDVHKHDTHTGKVYAASKIENCNVVLTDWSLEVDDPSQKDTWPGLNGTWFNYDVLDYYGYDPKFSLAEYSYLKPNASSTNKIFHWFSGDDLETRHLEYEGAILRGKMMAHTFLTTFTNVTLPLEWIREDIATQFPLQKCDPNDGKPSQDNLCWMDLRTNDDLANETCTTTSPPTTSQPTTSPPTTSIPTTSPPTTSIPTTSIPTTSIPTTSIPTTQAPTFGPTVAPVSTGTAAEMVGDDANGDDDDDSPPDSLLEDEEDLWEIGTPVVAVREDDTLRYGTIDGFRLGEYHIAWDNGEEEWLDDLDRVNQMVSNATTLNHPKGLMSSTVRKTFWSLFLISFGTVSALLGHQFYQKRKAEERQHLAMEDDTDNSYQDEHEPDQLQALVDGQPQ